tara:strand:+ start:230 stop:625 length:396 start_codon:yes stop_codon:yes gene_type:complete
MIQKSILNNVTPVNDVNIISRKDDFLKAASDEVFKVPCLINQEKANKILKSAFSYKKTHINELNINTVVIHIRSGDIFSKTPHPGFIPLPAVYYTNILNTKNFNKIIIDAEYRVNPVINNLLNLYPVLKMI